MTIDQITMVLQEHWAEMPPQAAPLTIAQLTAIGDILSGEFERYARQVIDERVAALTDNEIGALINEHRLEWPEKADDAFRVSLSFMLGGS